MLSNEDKNPIEVANEIINKNPIILDTETTGVKQNDEIIEIAVVDIRGNIQINTLVKPRRSIPSEATEIHGIKNRDTINAQTMEIIWKQQLKSILNNRLVCIYNSDFDIRLIRQSLKHYGIKLANLGKVLCVMKLYAQFRGLWDDYYGHFKWYKLTEAARQSNISVPNNVHRALADAELTRKILIYISSQGS